MQKKKEFLSEILEKRRPIFLHQEKKHEVTYAK